MSIVSLPPGQLYKGKYRIPDPDKIEPIPRTKFLQGLFGEHEHEVPLEGVAAVPPRYPKDNPLYYKFRDVRIHYTSLKAQGARLPKLSKWFGSLFPNDKELLDYVAQLGQKAGKKKIVFSGDTVDILRASDSPHFQSCLGWYDGAQPGGLGWHNFLPQIVEKYPGIAVVYIDDAAGHMISRSFMAHAKVVKTGEDVVVITQPRSPAMQLEGLAALLAGKTRVFTANENSNYTGQDGVRVNFEGGFPDPIHFDIPTWKKNFPVQPVTPVK